MLPKPKSVLSVVGASVTAGSTTTASIDTLGYEYAEIKAGLRGLEATTAPAVFKIQQSDVPTNATTWQDVSGLTTVPTSIASSSTTVVKYRVDLRNKARYLRLVCSPGTHGALVMSADLYRGKKASDADDAVTAPNLLLTG